MYGQGWWADRFNRLLYPFFALFEIPYYRQSEQQWTLCCDSYYF